jgi:circadian clock protein KaiB
LTVNSKRNAGLSPRVAPKTAPKHRWHFKVYVADETARSINAVANLNRICHESIGLKNCRMEIIDLLEDPSLARENQIVAIPTVVRCVPAPERRVLGDLSDTQRVLRGLDLPDLRTTL